MAKWQQFPDASAEVERLRVELEQARAQLNETGDELNAWRHQAIAARAERDDLAARLQQIQQAERKYTAAKLTEAAKMRKGQAI